jgi:hypothetical protein
MPEPQYEYTVRITLAGRELPGAPLFCDAEQAAEVFEVEKRSIDRGQKVILSRRPVSAWEPVREWVRPKEGD